METIIYLQNFGFDYFEAIRRNLDKLNVNVLEVKIFLKNCLITFQLNF